MSSDDEQPSPSPVLRPVVDWRLAAEQLARGLGVAATARQVGCSRSQLSRRRNHDPLFQSWIKEYQANLPPVAERRIGSLRQRLHDAIDAEVKGGNVRVILWLADRLKLVAPPSETKAASAMEELLKGMTSEDIKEFEGLKEFDG